MSEGKTLGNQLQILSGFPFPSTDFTRERNGEPLIRIRDLQQQNPETYFSGNYDSSFLVSRGDVLVGMDGDFNAVKWQGPQALLNQRVCKITTKDPAVLSQDFLYHSLQPHLNNIHKGTAQTTVKHLSTKDLYGIDGELPPLAEQKKIAEILSGIDKSISTLNASAKKFRELVSASEESTFSVFRKDDLERQAQVVHDDKEAVALGDIFEFRNGLNYSKANTGRGLRVVGVGHFKDYRTPKYELLGELSPGGLDFKSSLLEEGDFLFVRSNGNRLLIGRCLSIENIPADTPVAHSGFTIRARPKNQHSYTRNYIKQLLQSRVFRRSVAELGGGTNISNLSQDILADTIIALPSIQRQEKESSGLLAIQDLLDHTQRKLTQLQALKTSLQSDLLSGRKRVSV